MKKEMKRVWAREDYFSPLYYSSSMTINYSHTSNEA
jgi:hypothetical protein